jgi:hypothetical protein
MLVSDRMKSTPLSNPHVVASDWVFEYTAGSCDYTGGLLGQSPDSREPTLVKLNPAPRFTINESVLNSQRGVNAQRDANSVS